MQVGVGVASVNGGQDRKSRILETNRMIAELPALDVVP
jgi:hypothetical protein